MHLCMSFLVKRSDQEEAVYEMFHTARVSLKVFEILSQRKETLTIYRLWIILYPEEVEKQRHGWLASLILAPVLENFNKY